MKHISYRNMLQGRRGSGFTLIELLVVITIISVLAVVVFVALDPARRIKEARDARRTTDVQSILTAVHQSIVDNKGVYPQNMPVAGTEVHLGTAASGCAISTNGCAVTAAACVNLMTGTPNLVPYFASMPIDPIGGATYDATKTGYSVVRDVNGIVTIKACAKEGTGPNISVSR